MAYQYCDILTTVTILYCLINGVLSGDLCYCNYVDPNAAYYTGLYRKKHFSGETQL